MKSVLLFLKTRYRTILFFLLSISLLGMYVLPEAGYTEQQRKLWNEYMDQSPDYAHGHDIIIMYERSMLYDRRHRGFEVLSSGQKEQDPGELIQIAKTKIHDLNQKEAPDWEIDIPLRVNLAELSLEGMTEWELFTLPLTRHTSEYYAELLTRFQKDGQKSREILLGMTKKGVRHSDFLSKLFEYMSGYKRSFTQVNDSVNISKIPGYADYMSSVNSGDFSAYKLGKAMGFSADSLLLEKKLRNKANQGDSLAQNQLGNLLMERLHHHYNLGDTWKNWDKAYVLPSFLEKFLNMLPDKYAFAWKEKILKQIPKKKFLNKLPEKEDFDEALHWYKKAADQGNTDAMYAWLTCSFNYIPRYFTRSDWKRIRDYNDAIMRQGDWRACLQLTFPRKVTLHFIPFLLYSYRSLDSLVRKVDESGRGYGSLSYLRFSVQRHPKQVTGIAAGNRRNSTKATQWIPLSSPDDLNLASRLKKLSEISPYSCTFGFIHRNYIEQSSSESIQITKNVLDKYAQKGDPVSQYILGWFYQEGLGCDKDAAQSVKLWEDAFLSFNHCGGSDVSLAPDTGTAPLVYALPIKLIEYNLNPDFPERNPARAFELATLMQDCNLARMEKNTNLNAYRPSFLYYLGIMYEQGEGTTKDPAKAFACYQKGSNLGNPYCILGLARCYDLGIGVDMDKKKAAALYEEASFKTYNPDLQKAIRNQKNNLKSEI